MATSLQRVIYNIHGARPRSIFLTIFREICVGRGTREVTASLLFSENYQAAQATGCGTQLFKS